jgi:cytochrome c-type biogenesis protein CcmF
MGTGTVLAWRKSSKESLRRNFQNPMITATVGTIILAVFIPFHLEAFTIFWIAIFVTVTILIEVGKAAHVKGKQLQAGPLVGLIHVFQRNQRRYGGLVIHLGVVLMFLGFAGTFFSEERDLTLEREEMVPLNAYYLKFTGVEQFQVRNATHRAAIIEVYDQDKQLLEVMKPAKSFYPTQPQPLTEIALRREFLKDLYLIFSSESGADSELVTIKTYVNPLVGWAWMALPVFTLGIGICLTYRPRSLTSRQEVLRQQYIAAEG